MRDVLSVVLIFLFVEHISIPIGSMSVDVVKDPGGDFSSDDEDKPGGPDVEHDSSFLLAVNLPGIDIVTLAIGVLEGIDTCFLILVDSLSKENTCKCEVCDGSCPAGDLSVPSCEPLESVSAVEVSISKSQE